MHAFDVLGDPVRRRILELLREQELGSGDLVERIRAEFGISQPAVSQHLRVLRENGFATATPAGTRRVYAVDPHGNSAPGTALSVTVGSDAAYSTAVKGDGANRYWRMSEPAGNNIAFDSIAAGDGYGNQGVTAGGAGALISEPTGRSYAFNGTSGVISSRDAIAGPQTFSVEAWFKTTSAKGGPRTSAARSGPAMAMFFGTISPRITWSSVTRLSAMTNEIGWSSASGTPTAANGTSSRCAMAGSDSAPSRSEQIVMPSCAPAIMSELFPTSLRGLGIGAWYNLTVAVFGGTAPLLLTALSTAGWETAFFAYVAVAAVVAFFVIRRLPETSGTELR